MPYIAKVRRNVAPTSAGDLNYALCKYGVDGGMDPEGFRAILDEYKQRVYGDDLSYRIINEIVGAAFGAILETNRRFNGGADFTPHLGQALVDWYHEVAGPYEDEACERNGDVFPNVRFDPSIFNGT